jgi:hypothetical protein
VISERNIIKDDGTHVTFRYLDVIVHFKALC